MPRMRVRMIALALVPLMWGAAGEARSLDVVRGDPIPALREAASRGRPAHIAGIPLGEAQPSEIELIPFDVWASDARVVVHHADGSSTELPAPTIATFKGRVIGKDDSSVFLSLHDDGRIDALAIVRERRFRIATALPARESGRERRFEGLPLVVGEVDDFRERIGAESPWSCELEAGQRPAHSSEVAPLGPVRSDAGNVAGATYRLRLAIETDDELYEAFGSVSAVTDHLTLLAGYASLIYERDAATTLLIGHANIYSGGAGSDPWEQGTSSAVLNELGTWYATTNTSSYGQVQRSAVVMVSGRRTGSGVAWLGTLCGPDILNSPGVYRGAYAFCGSPGSGVRTTVPDPTLTVGGVQYRVPTDAVFWMLHAFTHELGHVIGSPHSHCIPLTQEEKATYGVTRDWVDLCSTETACNSGSTSAPPELGTIMSYCHNITEFDFGTLQTYRQSRYLFGKAGEPSFKMLGVLKEGLEGATPNPTITAGVSVPCAAGQTASVATCTGCTYQWSIEGGTITSSTTGSSITYTPNASPATLTVTVTTSRGCGIRLSHAVTTQCVSVLPPAGVVATATGSTSVQVTWSASANATSYNVYRSSGGAYTLRGSSNTTAFTDNGAAAGTAYLYRVRAVHGGESADSNSDLATTVVFTDPTLTAGITTIKAAHFNELRTAVNAVRSLVALTSLTFTPPSPATGVSVRKTHLDQLRAGISEARSALALSAPSFSDTIVAGSTPIKASHLNELRNAVK